jgi:hypothetical protein
MTEQEQNEGREPGQELEPDSTDTEPPTQRLGQTVRHVALES